ncbi:DNA polymerase (Fragment), partial [Durusdinium trenchii]
QVTPPTPAKVKALRPSADVPVLYGTLLVLEVLRLPMETTLTPPIAAVAYCLRDERVRSLLADVGKGETYEDGLGVIYTGEDSDLGEDIQVKAVSSELELFGAVAELFHAVDPAVVLGYDIVKGSVGLLLARAQTLGLRCQKTCLRSRCSNRLASG